MATVSAQHVQAKVLALSEEEIKHLCPCSFSNLPRESERGVQMVLLFSRNNFEVLHDSKSSMNLKVVPYLKTERQCTVKHQWSMLKIIQCVLCIVIVTMRKYTI